MKNKLINEVRKFQKIAGILKENDTQQNWPSEVPFWFYFGYDTDNITMLEDYLLDNYKIKQTPNTGGEEIGDPDAIMDFDYGEEVMGALQVLNPILLKDPKFKELVLNCKGGGFYDEDIHGYEDEE